MISTIDPAFARQIADAVKEVCGSDINFIDRNGIIFASTDETRVGTWHEIGQKAALLGEAIEVADDAAYPGTLKGINLPIYHNHTMLAVIGITGEPDEVRRYVHLAERITHLLIREQELAASSRKDEDRRHYIVHSLIHGENLGTPYLEHLLDEQGMQPEEGAYLLLFEIDSRYHPANVEMMTQEMERLFEAMQIRLFTFYYPNRYMAVAPEAICQNEAWRLKRFAQNHQGILKVAVGTCCRVYEMEHSYRSAQTALDGLETGENYVEFDSLTLEILLSEIRPYTRETFCEKILSGLSGEDCGLMRTYFETGMSLAATCEKLYLHKNTVQYRLNRIAGQSGRNPRCFRDAVLFYLALRLRAEEDK
ncbi:MAG: helix-turn-helix domain-containing protein [Clostridiales bacterium]|nr:helix-turn-helix domain-containing protein [Clostridiales bacterium]